MNPATTLAEIRKTCSPGPLKGRELDDFFVETGEARDELGNLRKDLKAFFEEPNSVRRVLVYGHRGCGKSTELNRLKSDLGDRWFVVSFSIYDYLPLFGINATDILLAMALAIGEATKAPNAGIKIGDDHLQNVCKYFAEVTESTESSRQAALDFSGGAGAKDNSLWAQILFYHAAIKGDLKFASRNQQSSVLKVRQSPSDLIVALDNLIGAVTSDLKESNRELLIIVEDLDKISLADAHDVFIKNAPLLASPLANLIYTIPLFTFYSADADAIRAEFDQTMVFPMLKVVGLDGQKAAGYAVLEEIIRKRVSEIILEDDAMDLLIRGTGGVLRDVFEALKRVSTFRNILDRPINRQDIRNVLDRLSVERGTQIGWPADADGKRRSPTDLYERLAEIARIQADKKRVLPTNDSLIEVLLRSGALIEYNGNRWLGVHPLARKYLQDLGQEIGPDPYGL